MEMNSVGYLRCILTDLSNEGSGSIINRDTQEEQNEKMAESNLRVHDTSCVAPTTAGSQSPGNHLEEDIHMVWVAVP